MFLLRSQPRAQRKALDSLPPLAPADAAGPFAAQRAMLQRLAARGAGLAEQAADRSERAHAAGRLAEPRDHADAFTGLVRAVAILVALDHRLATAPRAPREPALGAPPAPEPARPTLENPRRRAA